MNKAISYHPTTADCDVSQCDTTSIICKKCGALQGQECKGIDE